MASYVVYGPGGRPVPLEVSLIEPRSGTLRGGTRVTIVGAGLSSRTRIFFGASAIKCGGLRRLVAVEVHMDEDGADLLN